MINGVGRSDGTKEDHPVTLAVVSTSPVIRNGLTQVLTTDVGFVVVGSVESIAAVPKNDPPDVLIVDVSPGYGGNETPLWTQGPEVSRIVALCSPDALPDVPAALTGGVRAMVTRDSGVDAMLLAVSTVLSGGVYIGPELVSAIVDQLGQHRGIAQRLPEREAEALRLLTQGLTHRQIGRRMNLTEATVSTYVKRIRVKLNAGNKAELTRRAIELGYVPGRGPVTGTPVEELSRTRAGGTES